MRPSAFAAWLLAASPAAVCAAEPAQPPTQSMVVVPRSEARFVPVNPALPDGPRWAVLWGDPATGPSAMLLEMKKGSGPMHIHTADYHLVVLEGVMKHWGDGESEANAKPLEPGSYWFQPGGQAHGDACLTERCLMQIVWSGARDARLATSPAK